MKDILENRSECQLPKQDNIHQQLVQTKPENITKAK